MHKTIVISIDSKLAIGLGLALLMLGFGCSKDEEEAPAPEDIVMVRTASQGIPELAKLLPEDSTAVILIRKGTNDRESPVISPFTRDGQPKNLCGSSGNECELITSPDALLRMVSANANTANTTLSMLTASTATTGTTTDAPGTCQVGQRRYDCHKTGIHKDKRRWHGTNPDTKIHRQCENVEGCQ
jgi:hypothetical protein